jgi:hypothetical protein
MSKSSPRQRKTIGRVMHEYEHGELKSGPKGKGGKVKSRKQAIAIALKEAGASKYESDKENRESRARTERKEARGETYQQKLKANRMWEPAGVVRAPRRWAAATPPEPPLAANGQQMRAPALAARPRTNSMNEPRLAT